MNLLFNTVAVAGGATALALVAGLAVAVWLLGCGSWGRTGVLILSGVCLALPPFLAANCWLEWTASWRLAWGAAGASIAYLPLTALVLAGLTWPLTTLLIFGLWSRLERAHLEILPGLRGWALFSTVLWPVARPGLAIAAALTFTLAAGNFAIPTLFQVRVLPEELWIRFNTQMDTVGAWRAGLPLALLSALALGWIGRHPVPWPQWRGETSGAEWRRRLNRLWLAAIPLGALAMGFSAGLPLLHLLGSERTWQELGGAVAAGRGAIGNSISVAAGTATWVTGVALLATRRALPGAVRWALTALFFVPGILLASVWVPWLARPGLRWLADGLPVLALVLGLRCLGLTSAFLQARAKAADGQPGSALRVAGASGLRAWWLAVWPQVGAAAGLAWYAVYLLSLWEVEAIILILPPGGETLAIRIFNLLHYGHAGQVNALCLVLLGVALLPMVGWGLWRGLAKWRPLLLLAGAGLATGCNSEGTPERQELDSRWFSHVQVIGSRGVAPGQFNKPRSLVCDRDDNLYVADITGRIQKFDARGRYMRQWQMPQTDLGKPKGMGLDPFGNVLVVEPHYMRVNHFTPDGRLVAQWGRRGTNVGSFILPRGIAVNSQGQYLLSEYTVVDRVQRFSPWLPGTNGTTGTLPTSVQAWGSAGAGAGQFNRAEGLGVGPDDAIYVADSCNHRIQIFDAAGRFVRSHGRAGTQPGAYSYPYDIRVDAQGHQFICEFGNSRITLLDARDQVMEVVGGPGLAPGRFANPWAVALDSHGNLYVADSQNHRVQKLCRRGVRPASLVQN